MRRAIAVCALLFVTVPLLAAKHVWLGAVSNRFSDPLNWAEGGAPLPGEEAELEFPVESEQLNVINDIAGLHVKSITTGAAFEISGQAIVMTDALINGSNGNLTIWNDIDVEGTLTLSTYFNIELKGALSGNGGLRLSAAEVTFSGTRPNTYRGETLLDNASVLWLQKENAIAVPGNLRATINGTSRIHQLQPEQIADSATVTLTGGELSLRYDETIDTLRSSGTVFSQSTLSPKLIVQTLEPDANFAIQTDVRFMRSSITLPQGAFVSISGQVSVPPNEAFEIHGPGGISYYGAYSSPTVVDGAAATLEIPNSVVAMTGGVFNGTVASLTAAGGRVERLMSRDNVRFGSEATFFYYGQSGNVISGGVLDLGNATLDVDPFVSGPETLFHNGTGKPVAGTFKGLPEGAVAFNRYRISYKGGSGRNDVTLTELPRPKVAMSIATDPSPAVVGDPVTITAALTGPAGQPTGTVTFTLLGAGDLGTAPIVNGKASLTTRLSSTDFTSMYAYYSGDAVYASSKSLPANINIVYPALTITAVEPASGRAGTMVPVTIRGSGFVADSRLFFGTSGPIDRQVVSSSEIHATLDLTRFRRATTSSLVVVQADGSAYSNQVPFTITGDPAPPSPISFDDAGTTVSFATTKGSKTAWIAGASDLNLATNFLVDSDNDGIVRWVWPTGHVPEVMIGAVDLTAGTFAFNGRGNADLGAVVLPWPKQSFARDASGAFRSFIIPGRQSWLVLWARPGTGAWRALVDDGGDTDADATPNNVIFANTTPFVAMGDSPAHPASFAKGDIVIAYSRGFLPAPRAIYAGKLGDEIDEVVPGHIAMATLHTDASEDDGVTHIPVIRTGGANASATVHYRTFNGSAIGGYDFTAVADGVLTFAPGEAVQFIEVPLRNDNAYSPDRTFTVQLFNATGAILDGLEQSSVYLYDFDRPPVFDVPGPTLRIVFAGEKPTPIEIPLTLNGAFTQPVTIRWTATTRFGRNASGQVIFQPGESYKGLRFEIPAASQLIFGDDDLQVSFDSSIDILDYVDIHIETKPNAHIVPSTASESAGVAHVAITLDHPLTQRTQVEVQTEDVSATAGADYTATRQTVTFEAGQTKQTFDVPILNDAIADGDETFEARAYFPTGEIAHALVTITDDEVTTRPRLTIDDRISITEGNGIASGSVTLRLSAASTLPVTVHMESSDGTASAGYDYDQIYDTVTFAPGETTKSVPVFVYGDTSKEPNETFFVTLDSATNATLDPSTSRATITIVDEDPAVPVRRRGLRH